MNLSTYNLSYMFGIYPAGRPHNRVGQPVTLPDLTRWAGEGQVDPNRRSKRQVLVNKAYKTGDKNFQNAQSTYCISRIMNNLEILIFLKDNWFFVNSRDCLSLTNKLRVLPNYLNKLIP